MAGFFYVLILPEEPQVFTANHLPNREQIEAIVEVFKIVKKISATDGILMFTDVNSLLIRDIICISTK